MTVPVQQPIITRNGAGARDVAQMPIRCLVVDDHPAILAGLRGLLGSESDLEVVDALDSAEAAAEVAARMAVDVAIVDYQLPGHSGLWLSRKLKRLPVPPAVLIYSAFSDYLLCRRLRRCGGRRAAQQGGAGLRSLHGDPAGGERSQPAAPGAPDAGRRSAPAL